ncbi:MAG: VOC family protein [Culicoidibacterales bacterium]
MIFVNLPVQDLPKSMEFFRKLGWNFNLDFTDEQGACLVISDTIFVMLLVPEFFTSFTNRLIATAQTSEVIISLSATSRDEVDQFIAAGLAAGATETTFNNLGWMYQRGFADLDNYLWEFSWMDTMPVTE